eukprot:g4142.t1
MHSPSRYSEGLSYSMADSSSAPTSPSRALPSATGSKAVLSALRALQDKIRRMESERSGLVEHVAELKKELSSSSAAHERERSELRTRGERHSREASDAVSSAVEEKNHLNLLVVRAEEQKKALTRELQHVNEGARQAEDERRLAQSRVAALEKRAECLEKDLREAVSRGREAAASAVRARAEAEEAAATSREAEGQLNAKLAGERAARIDADARVSRLEQMLQAVMAINQGLVARINEKATGAAKKKGRRRRPLRRGAGFDADFDEGAAEPPATRASAARRRAIAERVRERAPAHAHAHAPAHAPRVRRRKQRRAKRAATSHQKLQTAYGKEDIPWMAGGPTGTATSHSVISTVQQALYQVKSSPPKLSIRGAGPHPAGAADVQAHSAAEGIDSSAAAGAAADGGAAGSAPPCLQPQPSERDQQLAALLSQQLQQAARAMGHPVGTDPNTSSALDLLLNAGAAGISRAPAQAAAAGKGEGEGSPRWRQTGVGAPPAGGGAPEAPSLAWASPEGVAAAATAAAVAAAGAGTASGADSETEQQPGDEMLGIARDRPAAAGARDAAAVIASIEDELAHANARYAALVREMGNAQSDQQLAATMAVLVDEIERKTQQLHLLKKAARKAHDARERAVVYSPDASRKKAASLRLLSSFRQIS